MKLEKKVLLQSRRIEKLEKENSSLKEKIEELESLLELQNAIPNEGFEKAKILMNQTAKSKAEYEKLIKELKESREKYKDEMHVLTTSIHERNAKIDSVCKVLNRCAI